MAKAKKNSEIDIAFNSFDTSVRKFLEQAQITLKDFEMPELPKQKVKRQTPLKRFTNPFRI